MAKKCLSDYGKLVLRFMKEEQIFSVWKTEVIDSMLDNYVRARMNAYEIFNVIVKAKNNPIMYGPRWETSRQGVAFWKGYFSKFVLYKAWHDENNNK